MLPRLFILDSVIPFNTITGITACFEFTFCISLRLIVVDSKYHILKEIYNWLYVDSNLHEIPAAQMKNCKYVNIVFFLIFHIFDLHFCLSSLHLNFIIWTFIFFFSIINYFFILFSIRKSLPNYSKLVLFEIEQCYF